MSIELRQPMRTVRKKEGAVKIISRLAYKIGREVTKNDLLDFIEGADKIYTYKERQFNRLLSFFLNLAGQEPSYCNRVG